MRRILGHRLPTFSSEESKKLKHGLDFIGVNHYTVLYAKDCMYSPCDSGGHLIEGFVQSTGERDGVPIGERVLKCHLLYRMIKLASYCSDQGLQALKGQSAPHE